MNGAAKVVNPKFVQELLGHADVGLTLNTYSHYLPSMGEQTALAMEGAFWAERVAVWLQ